jgi:hypothetical protein
MWKDVNFKLLFWLSFSWQSLASTRPQKLVVEGVIALSIFVWQCAVSIFVFPIFNISDVLSSVGLLEESSVYKNCDKIRSCLAKTKLSNQES